MVHWRHEVTTEPRNLSGFVEPIDRIEVNSWYRQQNAAGEPEEVHLIIHFQNRRKRPAVLRLKSESAVEALISALENHKLDVWGDKHG